MATLIPVLPTSELVALTCIRDLVTAYGIGAGTTLQGPDPETHTLSWGASAFVTARAVGGSINGTVPLREPVLSIEVSAVNEKSKSRPPWGRANSVAEMIVRACYSFDFGDTERPVSGGSGGDAWLARVCDMSALTEPQRIPGDEAGYARYSFEMSVSWLALTPAA